jgi:penicillin-binding protein 2
MTKHRPAIRFTVCSLVVILLLTNCRDIFIDNNPLEGPSAATVQPPTPAPPTPTLPPPSPETTAAAFLNGWQADDYALMYALLSPPSRVSLDMDAFVDRYQRALTTATVLTVTTRLQSALQEGDRAYVSFQLSYDTALVGTLTTDLIMPLSLHGQEWLVDWDAGLIWPLLADEHYFWMEYIIPARANIYDRAGLGLATIGTIVTLGVIPGEIEDEDLLLGTLELITDLTADEIRGRYVAAPADWKIPIADIPGEVSVEHNDLLSSIPGIYRDEKQGRTYPRSDVGSTAPHVTGWVSPVPAEQLEVYRDRGYRGDEWVGIAGLEAWGEYTLAGQHGGVLTIVTSAGEGVAKVAERPPVPSRPIYTTFDRGFQQQVQQILGSRKGAIIVLDVHTGAIRALASGPGFDANAFIGPAGAVGRSQILADPRRPLFNRATQGAYPAGSVFKIVTLATALEKGGMDPDQTFFYCPGYWEGLGPAARKECWKTTGHGNISLREGLIGSCNVVFYSVGQILDGAGQDLLPEMGRGLGFGELTGLIGIPEESGLMPDPEWKVNTLNENWWVGDTVNLSIGQGHLIVTPLQIARMMAAIANGGTLYRPYVVDRIGAGGDTLPEQVTQPQAVGTLPLSPENLTVIQEALLGVTTHPIGTATHRFAGLDILVAGKTGTAEAGAADAQPHAWFAAYAPADNPEIALAVVVENAGEGSTVAAPLARQVIEAYYGLPLSPLPPQAEEDYTPPDPTPTPEG